METVNAKIVETQLGYEDHGIMTCWLHLDYGDSGRQGFGGYALGDEWGMKYIEQLLQTVGVDNWEDLVGKYVRVTKEHHKIHKIGNITQDLWFDPGDLK